MKMNEVKSVTRAKTAEIPTDDFSIDGIARAINKEFGKQMFYDIVIAIKEGYIQVCDDGIIIWCS